MSDIDIVVRLRRWIHAVDAAPASDIMDEAADEIERLRQQRNHWMRAATAFDEHLATMRVMLMEQPGVRFGGGSYERNDEKRGDSDTSRAALTDLERLSLAVAVGRLQGFGDCHESDALRGLLSRLGGGK